VLDTTRSTRVRASRRIAADPTSTALLLAGPTAVELWPGASAVAEREDGSVLVEAERPDGPARVVLRAMAPRRTPTAYVMQFGWSGEAVQAVDGRLRLAYAPTADGTPVTHAVLELDAGADGEPLARLAARGEAFLENLARAAETRNRAA
jgi:hypothetical protein